MANEGQPESQFNARADQAALALRQSLISKGRQMPERASVEVGPDGQPPAPPPPEGSYVRMAMEQMQRDQAQQQPQQPPAQPPMPRAEDQAEAPAEPPPQAPPPSENSDNANRRITELIAQLRDKDRELQQAIATSRQRDESFAQLEARLNALQSQHDQLIQQNLDHLDPETRAEVLRSAQVQQTMQETERRIMGQLAPLLQRLEEDSIRRELEGIARKYPGFSVETHGPLIQRFRQRNPACTIEQAFRAVAEPEELATTARQSASVVPPIVPPGNGRAATQRFAPTEQKKSDPNAELVEEAQRLKKLAQEGKATPLDWHEHLKRRLS